MGWGKKGQRTRVQCDEVAYLQRKGRERKRGYIVPSGMLSSLVCVSLQCGRAVQSNYIIGLGLTRYVPNLYKIILEICGNLEEETMLVVVCGLVFPKKKVEIR